jgi:multisubunit Na+/H+ antiporter MnhB subunit
MRSAVTDYGSLQKNAGTPPSNGAVRAEKGAEGLSNLALIGGLATLLAGVSLYAAVKTWLSWQHETTVVQFYGQEFRVQCVDENMGLGMVPVIIGGLGLLACCLGHRHNPEKRKLWTLGIALTALGVFYGACLLGLERATYTKNWGGPYPYYYSQTFRHLREGVWPQLESASIAVMSIGGIAFGAGVVGRGLLYWRRRAHE